ncbi:MAG: UPF0149 family protein [Gemmatimonadota bacterium]
MKFLQRDDLPPEALSFCGFQGFLFALLSAPDLVQPSEWLPIVFGGEMPTFTDEREAQRVLGEMMEVYNDVGREIRDGDPGLPASCVFREDVLSNLDPDAPIGEWCEGFARGHLWLEEAWEEVPKGEFRDEIDACVSIMTFFISREVAEAYVEESGRPGTTLEEMAETTRRLFQDAMVSYATIGSAVYEALYTPPEGAETISSEERMSSQPVGRNDPCPCGSGKKFKKCCGRQTH